MITKPARNQSKLLKTVNTNVTSVIIGRRKRKSVMNTQIICMELSIVTDVNTAIDKSVLKVHKIEHTRLVPGMVPFTCGICEFEATVQGLLSNHIESKHIRKENSVQRETCNKCERVFSHILQLKHHLCEPQSKFACELCTFRDVSLVGVVDHMKANHTKQH